MVALPGNQAENGENKSQPAALGETGLLDSFVDEELNAVTLRMYNEAKHLDDYSVSVKDASHPGQKQNPLYAYINEPKFSKALKMSLRGAKRGSNLLTKRLPR